MYKRILKEIKNYNKIIVLRHGSPDYDAYGSQMGLCLSLRNAFPLKEIYAVGDENGNNPFGNKMDRINSTDYLGSLVIICDTSASNMMYGNDYKMADEIICFDHHENVPDVGASINAIKSEYSSAAELITEFLTEVKIKITKEAADYLYLGMVGDSNRFLYKGTTDHTFLMASILVKSGADILNIYKLIDKKEKENERRFKGYVLSTFKIYGAIAYSYLSKEIRDKYNVSEGFASRGCIGLLSGIENIKAFVGFTEADNGNDIFVELRSNEKPVVEVAKAHGGGGHALACGCMIDKTMDYMTIVKEMNEEVNK